MPQKEKYIKGAKMKPTDILHFILHQETPSERKSSERISKVVDYFKKNKKGIKMNSVTADKIANRILNHIRSSGNKTPESILYLGEQEKKGLLFLMETNRHGYTVQAKSFMGYEIIWVVEETYCKLENK